MKEALAENTKTDLLRPPITHFPVPSGSGKTFKPGKPTNTINEDIIIGCRMGDRKAQESLYRAYYNSMKMLCLRYTKSEEDASEALNTGFLKVFKNFDRYNAKQGALYTWIRTIMVNTCLDCLKIKDRQRDYREIDQAIEVGIDADVIHKMELEPLLEMIRKLPPATRAVFNLYAIEGYTHKEIANLLNISDGTSKWHLSEARKILQQLINRKQVSV